jgi:hypothetical protein
MKNKKRNSDWSESAIWIALSLTVAGPSGFGVYLSWIEKDWFGVFLLSTMTVIFLIPIYAVISFNSKKLTK